MNKSTIDEIRRRFDDDVERFSNLNTGQVSTIDARLSLELITESAKRICPNAKTLLDIGCGAGNYTLAMLGKIPNLDCTLLDLSGPMLDKAYERVKLCTLKTVNVIQSDIRTAPLRENYFDIILAGAVLHHLRDDDDWKYVFTKLYESLKPDGCLMISDLVVQNNAALTGYTWECYADYLTETGGKEFCQKVLDYVEKEDTPRSINYQTSLMKSIGFKNIDILHKHFCFAAFCGIK
ncbi:MAG: class I SAM-dependent methyltransferase [Spirochaetaceae bacterium]|jgi:tRNA (cmo5U34)-methyltransferase|nr:class I SAM-dependent methyltransferase [Spirochaetaceae bacterium]